MSKLFSEIKIKNLDIKNRIVMPPMCMYCAKEDGKVTPWHIQHYATRAIGGTGLIIVEATGVCPEGRISSNCLGLWNDNQIEGMKQLVDTVHEYGAKIGIQLNHAGRKCTASNVVVEAPSPIAFDENSVVPVEMSIDDINATVEEFKSAAARAEEAGFDDRTPLAEIKNTYVSIHKHNPFFRHKDTDNTLYPCCFFFPFPEYCP